MTMPHVLNTVIPAKPRSGAEPGPMGHSYAPDGSHGSRLALRLAGMTVGIQVRRSDFSEVRLVAGVNI